METVTLFSKLNSLPENMKFEVSNFIDSLVLKSKKGAVKKPKFGSAKGKFILKPNFNDGLDDFKEYSL